MENNTYRPGAVTAQNNAAQAGIIPDTGCLCDNLQALTAVASHGRAKLGQCDRINPRLCPYRTQAVAAGLVALSDLPDVLAADGPLFGSHRLESVKLTPEQGANAGESRQHGYLFAEARQAG